MKEIWKKVVNNGLNESLSFSEQKKIKIFNLTLVLIFLVNFIFFLFSIGYTFTRIDSLVYLIIPFLSFSIIGLSFWLQFSEQYSYARFILLSYFTLFLTFLPIFIVHDGSENALFAILIAVMLFFDRLRYTLSMAIFILLCFLMVHFARQYIDPQFKSSENNDIAFYINAIFAFIVCYLALGLFKSEHFAYEKIIEQKNEELNLQKEEIQTTLELVEQERQKSDNLLLNILPEETDQELKATGTATPKHYDLVSVLFTDFKGFTQISEKLDPQQVIEELNKCFLAFDEICEKYHLEKIKTIGDSYMCAGGIPIANTSNPIDCVQAGLEMQTWMANWKAEKQAKGEQAWELRLGIHSGAVVAGVIGKNKFAYDIWGDAVNLASRMESSGEAGKVNISGATYELIKDKFECTYRGKIQAKNKGEVEMYFVEKAL